MGIIEKMKALNRQRQLRRGVSKSFYENAKRGMEKARASAKEGWFDKMQRCEGRKAKRRVFWREDAGRVMRGINNDAQNLIGRPLARKMAKKAHIRVGNRFRRRKKPVEMRII